MLVIKKPIEFDWNKGNIGKNRKHRVEDKETEEIFFDKKHKIVKDELHSGKEKRFILLGKTKNDRLLYTVFTIRTNKIRIISSRDINKKEVKLYEEKS